MNMNPQPAQPHEGEPCPCPNCPSGTVVLTRAYGKMQLMCDRCAHLFGPPTQR